MRLKAILVVIFILFSAYANLKAQNLLNGTVLDQVSNEALSQIKVINISNKAETQSDSKGEFQISAKVNDLLVFRAIGYRIDTVLVIGLKPLRHYLLADVNNLQTVRVNRIADYKEQYRLVLRNAKSVSMVQGKPLRISPSRLFGREGKQARYFKRMIKREQYELEIDRKFNAKTITAILPLKQPDLDAFIIRYRPSLSFVRRADADDFKFYLIDAYNKFKRLLPEQKKLVELKADVQ